MRRAFQRITLPAATSFVVFFLLSSISWANQKVYLTSCCHTGATVSVLDAMMDMEMGFIPAGAGTTAVAIGPDSMTAYIGLASNGGADTIKVVDVMMNEVMMSFSAGNGAVAIAISPDGSRGYIANKNDGTVTIFDPEGGTVIANVLAQKGGACLDVGVSLDGSKAYAVCQKTAMGKPARSVLAIISNSQVTKILALPGSRPFPGNTLLAISPDGSRAYVAGISTASETGYASIDLIQEQVLRFSALPGTSYGLAVHPMYPDILFSSGDGVLNYIKAGTSKIQRTVSLNSSGRGGVVPFMEGMRIAVGSVDDDVVAVVDNTDGQLTASIPTGAAPQRLVISNDEMTSLVGTTSDTLVHTFDSVTGMWVSDFEGGTAPLTVAPATTGSRLFVLDQGLNGSGSGVTIMDSDMGMLERLWGLSVPGAASMVMRADGKALYVGSSNGSISVIDTRSGSLSGAISLGSTQSAPALAASADPKTLYAAYAQKDSNVLSVINVSKKKITNTISLGGGASSAGPFVAVTPDGSRGYVTLMDQNEIAVVDLEQKQVAGTISLSAGTNPACIAIHPNGMTAYVISSAGLVVLDLRSNRVVGTITISGTPQNVAFTKDGSMAYVSISDGPAAVIDTSIERVVEYLSASNTTGVSMSVN